MPIKTVLISSINDDWTYDNSFNLAAIRKILKWQRETATATQILPASLAEVKVQAGGLVPFQLRKQVLLQTTEELNCYDLCRGQFGSEYKNP